MYEYFEERSFDQRIPGKRKKNVLGQLASGVTPNMLLKHVFSEYPWGKTRALEGRTHASDKEGVWPINDSRVVRYYGDPGNAHCPWHTNPSEWPDNVDNLARQFRLYHYFRVWDAGECRELVLRGVGVRVALEVTEEWYDPVGGIIEIPPSSSQVVGAHAIPLTAYDSQNDQFPFQNTWGEKWGNGGRGALPAIVLDRYLIEAWCTLGTSVEPPISAKSGLVCLLWKSSLAGKEAHGREIVDAASGERIAWAFLVRRGGDLDIEEFFVWPPHRRKGYGRKHADLINEFVLQSGLRVRAWVPFADGYSENRPALLRTLGLLGLHLHPSPKRFAAFLALDRTYSGQLREPDFPERPASVHEKLNPEVGTRLYTVWFGTNRKPNDPADLSRGFSGNRDDSTHYGNCKVSIPKSHRFGTIGSNWWRRCIRYTDDRLRVVERTSQSPDDFWLGIAASLREYGADERQGLVFLHGYNVDFEVAAIRAAQLGVDLKFPGVTAFFSWPSCGTVIGYPTDEACIEASEPFIVEFLHDFVSRSGVERVHLIAHSMGNRDLLRALQRLASRFSQQPGVPFGQIILAAPDIDAGVFAELAELYPRFSQRTTLYASPADRAVAASRWIHGYARAGLTPPVTVVPGIDTVEVPRFNVFELLGHGYYAEAEGLLHDVFNLIRWNAAPKDRQRLDLARTPDGLEYWVMNP
jgi:esterase/lipase superfamily enzyme/GNAT superfamily N-acetyltransferase